MGAGGDQLSSRNLPRELALRLQPRKKRSPVVKQQGVAPQRSRGRPLLSGEGHDPSLETRRQGVLNLLPEERSVAAHEDLPAARQRVCRGGGEPGNRDRRGGSFEIGRALDKGDGAAVLLKL